MKKNCFRSFVKVFSVLFAVLFVTASVPSFVSAESADLTISTTADLLSFAKKIAGGDNFAGKTVVLANDVTVNKNYKPGDPAPANPWPNMSKAVFNGTFDGQGHTLSGIYFSAGSGCGLFGSSDGSATVKNLLIRNSYFTASGSNIGGLFGKLSNGADVRIENVYSDAYMTDTQTGSTLVALGGFVGYLSAGAKLTVTGCVFDGEIVASGNTRAYGGFVGMAVFDNPSLGGSINVNDSAFYGSVSGSNAIYSGFTARVDGSAVYTDSSKTSITSDASSYTVKNCVSGGKVSCTQSGSTVNGSFLAQVCWANPSVSVSDSFYIPIELAHNSTFVPYGPNGLSSGNKISGDNSSVAPMGTVVKASGLQKTSMTGLLEMTEPELQSAGLTDWKVPSGSFPIPKTLAEFGVTCAPDATGDGINFFLPDLATEDKYVKKGILYSSTETVLSGFVEVKPGDVVDLGCYPSDFSFPVIEFFDSEKQFLSSLLKGKAKTQEIMRAKNILSYTVPDGAVYCRVNLLKTEKADFVMMINNGMTIKSYYKYIGKSEPAIRRESPLYQKSAIFYGDSLVYARSERENASTAQTAGWVGRIGYYNDMNYLNASVSGSSMSEAASRGTIYKQITNNYDARVKYDLVILEGMGNDVSGGAAAGVMSDSFNKASFNTATFAGGLEYAICLAKETYPKAIVGYVIHYQMPLNSDGSPSVKANMREYVDLAIRICEKWRVPYLNLYDDGDLNFNKLKVNDNAHWLLTDGTHLSSKGYDVVTPYIQSWMESLLPAPKPTTTANTPTTTEPQVVTSEPTGTTAVTTAAQTTTGNVTTTDGGNGSKTGGCGSTVPSVAALVTVLVATLFVFKKKKSHRTR